ncbi:hypothetical protein G4G28_19250 [Massilia sp. Dwa41.01b]|nr:MULTISPECIES: hypothetical protein [unclassified Massilia]QNA90098.1 hypothetical protein G4G28_19250 [Massilia sp. Dwa41.01b]QNB00989.1 hypothetical protein G4G31_22855 [Massilia sp. Se16.2.3]
MTRKSIVRLALAVCVIVVLVVAADIYFTTTINDFYFGRQQHKTMKS